MKKVVPSSLFVVMAFAIVACTNPTSPLTTGGSGGGGTTSTHTLVTGDFGGKVLVSNESFLILRSDGFFIQANYLNHYLTGSTVSYDGYWHLTNVSGSTGTLQLEITDDSNHLTSWASYTQVTSWSVTYDDATSSISAVDGSSNTYFEDTDNESFMYGTWSDGTTTYSFDFVTDSLGLQYNTRGIISSYSYSGTGGTESGTAQLVHNSGTSYTLYKAGGTTSPFGYDPGIPTKIVVDGATLTKQ